ncbi:MULTISPECIES: NUDIX hydrolase [unclassified Coleofasciculus]|uniref:NUDIX hydrolase n=1 Tax=unclassified Coleofasciculus TaxID=2692782 RepID=UPI001880B3CF|nr:MULTISPECIES: NUDIX hydrolase [unclassified Coleofasciculus]MBE9125357.1 NUDIX hydrolase [Coleofasciculus sp. LEGE 07081]MBE9148560.1 NUDIX hydrolase [Coleofasciculus sp. LEGE 07092]
MSSIQPWKTLSSQLVFDNQWCRVRQDKVELPSGILIDDYFVNVRPDIVLILAVTPEREIVFVRQYRHGVGEILLELPGGSFDPQLEDSLSAARRELEEETGYVAEQMIPLARLYDNPVKDTNTINLILAENAHPSGKQQLDLTEDVEIVLLSEEETLAKISTGEICVCGTVTALFLGLKVLSQC